MEIDLSTFSGLFEKCFLLLCVFFLFARKKRPTSNEKQEILKWVSDSTGIEFRSLCQLWDYGPKSLGRYIEQLNSQGSTWWLLQDLARSRFAVPQVMTEREMMSSVLEAKSEAKFLRLLKRLKEALDRAIGSRDVDSPRVSGDLIAKGVALSAALTGTRGVFFVYSRSNQLDDVKIEMSGPGDVSIETKRRNEGLMVSYVVRKRGHYNLKIFKNNWHAPGSPFDVNAQDPPPGYEGSFGANLWDKPETCETFGDPPQFVESENSSLPYIFLNDRGFDEATDKNFETTPSCPKIKRKSCPESHRQIELSQIAAAIILSRRFTNRMRCQIPDLTVERANDCRPELNFWSKLRTGSPTTSQREITYVSPEGATFPISVSGNRNENSEQKWSDPLTQSLEDWLNGSAKCGPGGDHNEQYRHPQTATRSFNQLIDSVTSAVELSKGPNGRIWTQQRSIGVNTDELWANPKQETSSVDRKTRSKGVQVGKCCIGSDGVNPLNDNEAEEKSKFGRELEKYPIPRTNCCHESALRRTKIFDTFNSEETCSSVATNFSEKVIEMDLRVNYEAIAFSKNSKASQNRGIPEIAHETNDRNLSKDESLWSYNDGSSQKSVADGIYEATLMNVHDSYASQTYNVRNDELEGSSYPLNSFSSPPTSTGENRSSNGEPTESNSSLLTSFIASTFCGAGAIDDPRETSYLNGGSTTSKNHKLDSTRSGWDDSLTIHKKRTNLRRVNSTIKKKWGHKLYALHAIGQANVTSKRQLRKTLCFIPRLNNHKRLTCSKTEATYSFGPYPVMKDVILSTPVHAWTNFWDGVIAKNRSIVRPTNNSLFEEAPEALNDSPPLSSADTSDKDPQEAERKRRFEMAKLHFKKLENNKIYHTFPLQIKSSHGEKLLKSHEFEHHWHFDNLFKDFHEGLGKPGVPNRQGVLATLNSVEPAIHVAGFETQYPHLPVSPKLTKWRK